MRFRRYSSDTNQVCSGQEPVKDADALIALIRAKPPFTRLGNGIHGHGHARRVLLFSQLIAAILENQPRCRKIDYGLLIVAALLHDCGRINDGIDPEHADRSAEMAVAFCQRHKIECSHQRLRDCIRFHCKSGRFHWSNPPIEALILADADKLDRYRFRDRREPLDESRLELFCSRFLVPLAIRINRYPDHRDSLRSFVESL